MQDGTFFSIFRARSMPYVSPSPECHQGQYLKIILSLFQWYVELNIIVSMQVTLIALIPSPV